MPIGVPVAFLAGLASFLSPCVLPLVPVYLSVLSGLSYDDLTAPGSRMRLVSRAAAFVAGFSLVFITLGMSASTIGGVLLVYRRWLEIAAGLLAIVFGLSFTGLVAFRWFQGHHSPGYTPKKPGLGSAWLLGMAFSVGWTPCVGPALGTILGLAGSSGTAGAGFILLVAYSAGLGLPFLAAAVLIRWLLPIWGRLNRFARAAQITGGVLMILMGLLLVTGLFARLSGMLGS